MSTGQRVVVKIGSSTLTDEDGRINRDYILGLADQVSHVRRNGTQVVIVSSGAIVAGLERLGMSERPEDMPSLQAAASAGQVALIETYASAFANRGISIGQVLLTRHDTSNRSAYLHARDTLERLLELGIVPIVNENDTVAVDEIRFGDNDTLAALVATLVDADLVILLSDIEGLYTADPRRDEDAQLLDHVGEFTEEIVNSAGGVGSKSGSGGMVTKVEAARVLMKAGIPMVICEGHHENVIVDAVAGEHVGTRFSNGETHGMHARKLWIALGGKVRGAIIIDDGACDALRTKGCSLLPVGVLSVAGEFSRGAAVNLRDEQGRLIGRGLTKYSSDELAQAAGHRMDEVSLICPSLANCAVIHRDELVVF